MHESRHGLSDDCVRSPLSGVCSRHLDTFFFDIQNKHARACSIYIDIETQRGDKRKKERQAFFFFLVIVFYIHKYVYVAMAREDGTSSRHADDKARFKQYDYMAVRS